MFLPPRVRSTRPKAATLNAAHRPSPQHPPKRPPRSPALAASSSRSTPLNDPAQSLQKNRDQSVGRHFGLYSLCQMVLCLEPLEVRTGGLPPNLRSGRLRPERQVLRERLALQERSERLCLQELRRLELRERRQQGLRRQQERVRVRFSRRGCRCTSGR